MGGLGILLIIGLYLALTISVIVKVKPIWLKGLALLLALLIPTADAVYGRYKLKQMCEAEGGLKVYRIAHGVEGFITSTGNETSLNKYNFDFIEVNHGYNNVFKDVIRYSKRDGQIVAEENVVPKSQYQVRSYHEGEDTLYLKYKHVVNMISTGEKLAEHTEIGFRGGWAEQFLAAFSDAGAGVVSWCTPPPWSDDAQKDVIVNSLKH
jgi:hypothetical protein